MRRVPRTQPLTWAIIAVCGILGACSKSEPAAAPETQPPLPAVTLEGIKKAISAYEQIGKSLAEDHANVRAEALTLEAAAQTASTTAPGSLQKPLDSLSGASQRLATLAVDDLAEVRSAFGEVSRAMISVLSAAPSLQEGLHLFECPMAEGYQKWVQSDESVTNPYMGSKMPTCGTPAQF
jgi:hypothetical protein